MTASPVPADPSWWQVATDAVIPALAIIISTAIAVWIARSDREAASRSAEDERRAAAEVRAQDRRDAAADRERARVERLLEELIALYAVFVSGNPHTTDFTPIVRQIRAKVTILHTVPTAAVLGEWLGVQTTAGYKLFDQVMSTMPPPTSPVDEIVRAIGPVANWADQCIKTIGTWLKGEITDADLRNHLKSNGDRPVGIPPAEN